MIDFVLTLFCLLIHITWTLIQSYFNLGIFLILAPKIFYCTLKIRLTKHAFYIHDFCPESIGYTMNSFFLFAGLKTKVSALRPAEWEAFQPLYWTLDQNLSLVVLNFELPQYIAIYVRILQGSTLFCFIHFYWIGHVTFTALYFLQSLV